MSPTGEARHLEEKESYVSENGFGHEEWLFNLAWLVSSYHYAFLQPVNKSFGNLTGQRIELLLYTINPVKDRLYVGEIKNCEVLTITQAEHAVAEFRARGWLKIMTEQVAEVGGRADHIGGSVPAYDVFNVRFRKEDLRIYDPLKLAPKGDRVRTLNRYILVTADSATETQWRSRRGSSQIPSTRAITRKGTPTVTYDPVHKRLQSELFAQLQDRFGAENVVLEQEYVDITVQDAARTVLIEIKTDPDCRLAIRHAIGQLLEYAYYSPSKQMDKHELLILAPPVLDNMAADYLRRVREAFKIPISYASYSEGDPLPGLFV